MSCGALRIQSEDPTTRTIGDNPANFSEVEDRGSRIRFVVFGALFRLLELCGGPSASLRGQGTPKGGSEINQANLAEANETIKSGSSWTSRVIALPLEGMLCCLFGPLQGHRGGESSVRASTNNPRPSTSETAGRSEGVSGAVG